MLELTLDALDFIKKINHHKVFILTVFLISTILAVLYAYLSPRYWSSTSVIRPLKQELFDVPALDEEFASISSTLLDQAESVKSMRYIEELLKSRRFALRTINRFNLLEYFEINEQDSLAALSEALKLYYWKVLRIALDEESKLIRITSMTKDRNLSKNIVKYQLSQLQDYNEQENVRKQRDLRMFLEQRINGLQLEIDGISNQIKEMQSLGNSYLLEQKVDYALKNYSQVFTKLLEAEIEYEMIKLNLSEESFELSKLDKKVNLLRSQLQKMENDKEGSSLFNNMSIIPEQLYQYHKMERKQKVLELVYEHLVPIYEITKLNEQKLIDSFEVIDPPELQGKHSKPKRAFLISFVALLSLILSCSWAVIIEQIKENQPLN